MILLQPLEAIHIWTHFLEATYRQLDDPARCKCITDYGHNNRTRTQEIYIFLGRTDASYSGHILSDDTLSNSLYLTNQDN